MLLKSGGRESAPRTRWRIIHVGFFRSSGIVHPFRRGAEHHPQLFNLLIFNDFSVNPTDGHQGSDASTVIGRPISAGEEAGRGPSAGVGLPGGWRQQTHMSGPPGSRDECTANGIARRKHGLRLHRRAWICPGPAPEATDSHAASVGDCKGPAADRSVCREQGSPPPPHRQAWTPDRDEHRGRQTCRRVSRRSRRMCGRPDRGLRARASPSLGSRPCTPGEAVPPAEARP